jgi:hypothetical protein
MCISGSFSTFVSKSCFLIRPLSINIRLSFEFLLRSIENFCSVQLKKSSPALMIRFRFMIPLQHSGCAEEARSYCFELNCRRRASFAVVQLCRAESSRPRQSH